MDTSATDCRWDYSNYLTESSTIAGEWVITLRYEFKGLSREPVKCPDGNSFLHDITYNGRPVGDVCVPDEVVIDVQRIIDEFRTYGWPSAELGVLPAGGEVLVNGETRFWARVGGPRVREFMLGAFRVRIEASPVSYRWHFGDSATATTIAAGSGDAPATSHRYLRAEEFAARADTTWTGRYWVDGDGPHPIDSTLVTRGTETVLTALEARPVLVQ